MNNFQFQEQRMHDDYFLSVVKKMMKEPIWPIHGLPVEPS